MKKYSSFTVWYILIIMANLIFLTWMTDYRMVSKPLIVGSLIGFYIGVARIQSPLFILALIFAMLGDIFLMFKAENFFLIGLGCFLVMQIMYAATFLKDRSKDIRLNTIKSAPVILLAVSIMAFLWQDLGSMQLPVTLYTAAITFMVSSALIRQTSIKWYLPVVAGVFLFMVSDAGIAFNKFGGQYAGAEYFIMITYMVAQYLIVRGVIERDEM